MAYYYKYTTSTSGQTEETALDGGDTAFVSQNHSLTRSSFVFGTHGSGNNIVIAGSVDSSYSAAIVFNGQAETLIVERSGQIHGFDAMGVYTDSVASHFDNAGIIASIGADAFRFGALSANTTSELFNSGTIRSNLQAISRYDPSTETITVYNTGLIEAGKNKSAFFSPNLAVAKDLITNDGKMVGSVGLGGGDDLYDGRGGKVTGFVNGADGNDNISGGVGSEILYGGRGADIISGGAGDDQIRGESGNDKLRGGLGNDHFYFEQVLAGNVDYIYDFSSTASGNNDAFYLDDAIFTGMAIGAVTSGQFKNITTGAVDSNDRILYNQDKGYIYYDSNGSGNGGRTQIADLVNDTPVNYKDFFVF